MIKIRVRRDDEGRILKEDTGSTLVIALVFMTVFGILLTVVMGFIDASFRATLAIRDQTNSMYAGDAAIDAAIQYYRSQFPNGRVNKPCPTYGPMSFGEAPDIYQVTVTCEGMPASGATFIPNFDDTVPEHAILTLSTNPTIPGIEVEPRDIGVKIRGDVWSRSTINVSGGTGFFDVEGAATAATSCNPANRINATTLTCSTSTVAADPNYPMATTTVPPPPPSMPSCTGPAGSVLKYFPGTYTSVAALNALTATSDCNGKIHWFQPGIYYFDFQDGDLWNISFPQSEPFNDQFSDFVAGTPRVGDWDPDLPTSSTNRPIFGRSCLTEDDIPVTDPPTDPPIPTGVQFIFGGVSRLSITTSGEFEMCAQPSPRTSAPQQQIAIFGVTQTSGALGIPTDAVSNPGAAESPATLGRLAYLIPSNALTLDDNTAEAELNSATPVADIRLKNLCQNCIPADSTINDVKLLFRHRENPSRVAQITGTVSWIDEGLVTTTTIPEAATCTTIRICRQSGGPLRNNYIEIDSLGLNTLEELNEGVTVTFEARYGSGTPTQATSELDVIRLEIEYSSPSGFQQQTGTMVAPANDSLHFFHTSGPKTSVAIHGTLYAPLSGIELFMNERAEEALRRGAIVRYVKIGTPSSLLFDGYPISLPEGSRGNRGILLRAIVDPPDAEPRVRVRAVVDIDDGCQDLPCEVGQTVTVRSWSFVR